jgi:hypothetical protein
MSFASATMRRRRRLVDTCGARAAARLTRVRGSIEMSAEMRSRFAND